MDAVAQLDAYCSLAIASDQLGGTLPTIATERAKSLVFEGLRHPMLPTGVPNAVELNHEERVLFLTGPNMAGKSTLLRALGIALYTAYLGMAVAAESVQS